jgi:hypothetical protein
VVEYLPCVQSSIFAKKNQLKIFKNRTLRKAQKSMNAEKIKLGLLPYSFKLTLDNLFSCKSVYFIYKMKVIYLYIVYIKILPI